MIYIIGSYWAGAFEALDLAGTKYKGASNIGDTDTVGSLCRLDSHVLWWYFCRFSVVPLALNAGGLSTEFYLPNPCTYVVTQATKTGGIASGHGRSNLCNV